MQAFAGQKVWAVYHKYSYSYASKFACEYNELDTV